MTESTELPDDVWLTLAEACERFFRGAIKPVSLRAEARRGHLVITRVGNKDFVTPAAIREMRVKKACQGNASQPGSTSTPKSASGSSETDRTRNALASAKASAEKLKKRSLTMSKPGSNPQSAKVLSLPSRSQRS